MYIEIECPQTGELFECDSAEFIGDSGDYVFETPEGLQFTATLEVDDNGNVLAITGYSDVVDQINDVVYL